MIALVIALVALLSLVAAGKAPLGRHRFRVDLSLSREDLQTLPPTSSPVWHASLSLPARAGCLPAGPLQSLKHERRGAPNGI
jgi:hypothetical protein